MHKRPARLLAGLVALGLLTCAAGGPRLGILGLMLSGAAAPLAVAFWLAAVSWQRGWRLAGLVQLLPLLVVLGWSALILLSPMQSHSPAPSPAP